MKFALVMILICSQAFGAITPEEKIEALESATDVMAKLSGDRKTEKKIITAAVVDELGTRLSVEFSYVEDMSVKHMCSYSYDRVLKRVVQDSWTCNF